MIGATDYGSSDWLSAGTPALFRFLSNLCLEEPLEHAIHEGHRTAIIKGVGLQSGVHVRILLSQCLPFCFLRGVATGCETEMLTP